MAAIARTQAGHRFGDVPVDGVLGDAELKRDFFGRKLLPDHAQTFALLWAKRFEEPFVHDEGLT
ncbi:hypothetical protein SPDO_00310 [Sphingomonas dokdonensis]|uniref:Uncharacterized protein n=1 Tax=Sphingomonas dokdonensis TaxID=344880 RepID=A0A245ZTU4_9SPHN|nr:hypothetical protein SPDO_00310 [Sphingomonas dokdonensis]